MDTSTQRSWTCSPSTLCVGLTLSTPPMTMLTTVSLSMPALTTQSLAFTAMFVSTAAGHLTTAARLNCLGEAEGLTGVFGSVYTCLGGSEVTISGGGSEVIVCGDGSEVIITRGGGSEVIICGGVSEVITLVFARAEHRGGTATESTCWDGQRLW